MVRVVRQRHGTQQSSRSINTKLRSIQQSKKIAYKHIAQFEKVAWAIPFFVAFTLDFIIDLLRVIPFVGIIFTLFSMPLVVYMFVFNFRHSAVRAKVAHSLILLVNFLPVIAALWPGNIMVVFMIRRYLKRRRDRAYVRLAKLEREERAIMVA